VIFFPILVPECWSALMHKLICSLLPAESDLLRFVIARPRLRPFFGLFFLEVVDRLYPSCPSCVVTRVFLTIAVVAGRTFRFPTCVLALRVRRTGSVHRGDRARGRFFSRTRSSPTDRPSQTDLAPCTPLSTGYGADWADKNGNYHYQPTPRSPLTNPHPFSTFTRSTIFNFPSVLIVSTGPVPRGNFGIPEL